MFMKACRKKYRYKAFEVAKSPQPGHIDKNPFTSCILMPLPVHSTNHELSFSTSRKVRLIYNPAPPEIMFLQTFSLLAQRFEMSVFILQLS